MMADIVTRLLMV